MTVQSWRETRFLKGTHTAGSHFESDVYAMLKRYTNAVWRNVRLETLLTQTGMTELDIVLYFDDVLYILELKRVRRISGAYSENRWTMYGWSDRVDETSEYVSLNVIEKNNLHARSLIDIYHARFGEYIKVVPVTIVPDDCEIPGCLSNDVFTVSDLEQLVSGRKDRSAKKYVYRLAYLIDENIDVVARCDFVERGVKGGVPVHGKALKI